MSNQAGSGSMPSPLERMSNLLASRGHDYTKWLAHYELYSRRLISNDVMRYGLGVIYPMLTDPPVLALHDEIVAGTSTNLVPVVLRADYERLVGYINLVYWRQEQMDDMMDMVFDGLLETQKALIQQVQKERQRQLLEAVGMPL